MSAPKHHWGSTESQHNGAAVQRCAHCATERVRDGITASLFLYRRGRALVPGEKKLGERWRAFESGFVPKCAGRAEA